jgi:hypothetical protein
LLGRFPLSFNERNIVREFLNHIKKEVEYTNPGKNKEKQMKKFLKFAAPCACILALVGFILTLATPAITYPLNSGLFKDPNVAGTTAIFGKSGDYTSTKPSALALIAFILAIVAMLALICATVLPFLKNNKFAKFGGLLALIAGICLVVGCIFVFIVIPTFASANGLSNMDGWGLGAGLVVAAILYIVAGAVAVCPTVLNLLGK